MSDYQAPLRDIAHTLRYIVDIDELGQAFDGLDHDTAMAVIDEAGRFLVEVVAPTNVPGDQTGSVRNDDGSVTTAPGFKAAYDAYVDAGWGSVPFDPAYGGGGMPWTVGIAIQEVLTSCNLAFSLCPLLTQGAIDAIVHHGDEVQRELYLAKMISGVWAGTMNLTEPDAGSDVGALRTKAEPVGDGSFRISGTKIFITYGEQDLTENIVHLVLARTPGAPPGTKGISCFIVPKFLVNADGTLGERNDVSCVSVEHKMGIHGSPTCVMSFGDDDGAIGYLIGEEHRGMAVMFTMMNNARLSVGLSGLAVAERAYQLALQYSIDRKQGRAVGAPAGASSPIIEHADVRRMLMTMRSEIDAMRALLYFDSAAVDRSVHAADADTRSAAADLVALLTPISKGWSTDLGCELTSIGVQIHGGMGFIEETGAAQHFRDIRIAPIYEGTNGIQAMDLVMRKLPLKGGAVIASVFADIAATAAELTTAGDDFAPMGAALAENLAVVQEATQWLAENGSTDPNNALAGATPYLRMLGNVVGGWLVARSALGAQAELAAGGDEQFLSAKIASAQFFCTQVMPQAKGLLDAVTAGAGALFALTPEQFAP